MYRKPTYQTAAFHGKKCEKVPEEKCELVDENKCAKVPEKVCKKVKEEKCLTIPEETCRDVPTKECKKVPKFVASNNPIKVISTLISIFLYWYLLFQEELHIKCFRTSCFMFYNNHRREHMSYWYLFSRNVRSAKHMRMTSLTWFMTRNVSVTRNLNVTQLTRR